jgi:tetraacyldisaccharide 4'-kinase
VAFPLLVNGSSTAEDVGDEPVLIYKRTGVPVVIDPNRSRAVELLAANGACDFIISDDGMQHFAMHRDLEIAVIDGERLLGNGYLLPVGPLREKPNRLLSVDMLVCNNSADKLDVFFEESNLEHVHEMRFIAGTVEPLPNTQFRIMPDINNAVHAVAGIGNPERFFASLAALGFNVIPHAFSDHHIFQESDLEFGDDLVIIMTEKDAVKCEELLNPRLWFLPIEAQLPEQFYKQINNFLNIRESVSHHA